ncbi:MAG: M20/M25/M40 family metallo-hydrolase [Candidatus Aenigmarchaeota archaeon]|nr:M20/M25/M40 family metallo-hydrolase [Candidatus Aenigmarchaeota archaeon]
MDAVELTKKLVEIESVSGNEEKIAKFVYDFLKDNGFNPKLVYTEKNRPNVVCSVGSGKPKLLLNGHIDTVPSAEGWTKSPTKPVIENGKLFGLGALDQKSGIAIMLMQLLRLKNKKFRGTVTFTGVMDEELISLGTYDLIQKKIINKDFGAALFSEPGVIAGDGLFIVNSIKGRYAFNVKVHGKSGHGSQRKGVNAIVDAAKIIEAVDKLKTKKHPVMGSGVTCVCKIGGGTEFFFIPDYCEFMVHRSTVEGEDKEYCYKQLQDLVKSLKLKSRIEIEFYKRPNPFLDACMVNENEKIVSLAKSAFKKFGIKPELKNSDSVFDMNYTVSLCKIPSINIGPNGDNIHTADEYVNVDEIKTVEKIYTEIIDNFFGVS